MLTSVYAHVFLISPLFVLFAGRKFGGETDERERAKATERCFPLLLSVRSGAAVSMPGEATRTIMHVYRHVHMHVCIHARELVMLA
jgi:hypothetical protein